MAPLAPAIPTTILKIGLSRRSLFRIQNKIGYSCLALGPAPGYNRKRNIWASPACRQCRCGAGAQTEYYSRDHNMKDAGQKLKRARERLNLRYRDVERASIRIAELRQNEDFVIALSRLS